MFSQKKIAFLALIAQGATVLVVSMALTTGDVGAFTSSGWSTPASVPSSSSRYVPPAGNAGNAGNVGNSDTSYPYIPSGTTVGNISSSYASPSSFNPYNQTATISYTLSQAAVVDIDILSGSTLVKSLYSSTNAYTGTNSANWNGTWSNGTMAQNGSYTYRIIAYFNGGSTDTETGSITLASSNYDCEYYGTCGNNNNNYTNVSITNVSVSPSTFDQNSNTAYVYYTLNTSASVTVQVLNSSNGVIKNLKTTTQESGSNSASWDGSYSNGVKVPNGSYIFKIYAYATNGSNDSETAYVYAQSNGNNNNNDCTYYNNCGTNNGNGNYNCNYYGTCNSGYGYPQLSNVYVNVAGNKVTLQYYVSNAAQVSIKIGRTDYSKVIYDAWVSSGYQTATWYADTYLIDGYYTYTMKAKNNSGEDTETGSFYLDNYGYSNNGNNGGYYTGANACAGFYDVAAGSPYCKAIQSMKELGIFMGYPDGGFKPNQAITRAETVKVVLKSMGIYINMDNGSDQGFWDVQEGSWYMPYLRTAKKLGIIRGYPDKSFRPGQTVNRVELLKIFFQSSKLTLPSCNTQPYIDTPVTKDTAWYIDYVCYAKKYNLVGSMYSFVNGIYQNYYYNGDVFDYATAYFQPNKGMTRADVAELFYRAQLKGLLPQSISAIQNYTDVQQQPYYNDNYYYGNTKSCQYGYYWINGVKYCN